MRSSPSPKALFRPQGCSGTRWSVTRSLVVQVARQPLSVLTSWGQPSLHSPFLLLCLGHSVNFCKKLINAALMEAWKKGRKAGKEGRKGRREGERCAPEPHSFSAHASRVCLVGYLTACSSSFYLQNVVNNLPPRAS